MREETKNWWAQAQKDLESARKSLNADLYYVSAFLCQQAVEKGLKALYIQQKKQMPDKTHNLLRLAESVGFPKNKLGLLRSLNPDFVTTRYPDAANGIPAEIFDKDIAQDHLEKAEEVMNWIRKTLKN
ncbi:HEPN domain-containing protein [candidate division KSB1 bacterium]|nr:HEPN domain-containing protein [candidate division KSB1 bacterium]NIR68982.1 HEPN domain-containing protein [candidate division KSB1 bacterium]NIS22604.1 HEPN domain-containing protein [candidate division KSB1 bacterium]NIT69464.1 HEPN domain-containing protein [candidate division KSB1 bacterium]NIU23119.1 HEPN domain-containing protein [candidate division KSB1 bacterium]